MAAGLKEAYAAHDHTADREFTIEQFNQRHAAGNDVTPALVAEYFCPKVSCGLLESLLFNEADRFVGPLVAATGPGPRPLQSFDFEES